MGLTWSTRQINNTQVPITAIIAFSEKLIAPRGQAQFRSVLLTVTIRHDYLSQEW